jgi:hypothetical protein
MAKARFIVAAEDGRWTVTSGGGFRKAFDSRSEALREAVQSAHRSGREGNDAQALALDEKNELYPVWVYGQDALLMSD